MVSQRETSKSQRLSSASKPDSVPSYSGRMESKVSPLEFDANVRTFR